MSKVFSREDLIKLGLDQEKWIEANEKLSLLAHDVDAQLAIVSSRTNGCCRVCGRNAPDKEVSQVTVFSSPSFTVSARTCDTSHEVFFTRTIVTPLCKSCVDKALAEEAVFQQKKRRKAKLRDLSKKVGCWATMILGIAVGVGVGYWTGWILGAIAGIAAMACLSQWLAPDRRSSGGWVASPKDRLMSIPINAAEGKLLLAQKFKLGDISGEESGHLDTTLGPIYFSRVKHRIDL